MFGDRIKKQKNTEASPVDVPAEEKQATIEKPGKWYAFYSEQNADGEPVAFAESVKSYTSASRHHMEPVNEMKAFLDADAGMLPWVEQNAPGGGQDGLVAIEYDSLLTRGKGAVALWDAENNLEVYGYTMKKGATNPETDIPQLDVTSLTKVSSGKIPFPKGSRVTMSARGRVHQLDGHQIPATQSYERSFTAALRGAVADYRREHDPQNDALALAALTKEQNLNLSDSPFSIVEGEEADPMQLAVVNAQYLVESGDRDLLVRERIDGATVTDDGSSVNIARMNQDLSEVADEMTASKTPEERENEHEVNRAGKFIVEYPRENAEAPVLGFVVVPGETTKYYGFRQDSGGTIAITDRRKVKNWKETFALPRGTRVTTSVKQRLNTEHFPQGSGAAPTYEEDFTESIRAAIERYNEEHP